MFRRWTKQHFFELDDRRLLFSLPVFAFPELFFEVAVTLALVVGHLALLAKHPGNVSLVQLEIDQDKQPARALHQRGKNYQCNQCRSNGRAYFHNPKLDGFGFGKTKDRFIFLNKNK